jgi:ribose/xylose/arabinose/galactoside ABC-type transport system permease subunit
MSLGIAVWITNSVGIAVSDKSFLTLVNGKIFGIPNHVFFWIIFAILLNTLMARMAYGRKLYSTGINSKAARICDIPTKKITMSTYMISGLCAGIAGIVSTGRLFSAASTMASDTMIMDIVSSAIIGGVSTMGGEGLPIATVVGAITITLISNIMNLMNVDYTTTLVIKGLIILLVVSFERFRKGLSK